MEFPRTARPCRLGGKSARSLRKAARPFHPAPRRRVSCHARAIFADSPARHTVTIAAPLAADPMVSPWRSPRRGGINAPSSRRRHLFCRRPPPAAFPGRRNGVRPPRRISNADHGRSRSLATLCAAQQLRMRRFDPIFPRPHSGSGRTTTGMHAMILREILHAGLDPLVAGAALASTGGDVAAHSAAIAPRRHICAGALAGAPDGVDSATRVRPAIPANRRRSRSARICAQIPRSGS